MTHPADLYAFYVSQRRTYSIPGFYREDLPGLTRYTPLLPDWEGIIVHADLPAEEADATIAAQVSYFAERGQAFEWKVHTLNRPADLGDRLRRRVFAAAETEAFMLYPLTEHHRRREVAGIQIRPIEKSAQLNELVKLHENLEGGTISWLLSSLQAAQTRLEIFGAYAGDRLVGTGWTEFPPGSAVADLHGGSVLPEYRGRSIYSSLFDVRARSARRRGVEWLMVDAAPMSRPILLRQGFRLVCETTPFRMAAAPAGGLSDRSTV